MSYKNKFKVGDKVRRISAGNTPTRLQIIKVGDTGTVTSLRGNNTDQMMVDGSSFIASQFELVVEPATNTIILDTAKNLISGSRAADYGDFSHNAQQQADLWNAYLRTEDGTPRAIEPMDVPAMMVLVKLMRLAGNNTHQDSWVDVAGFAGLAEQVHDKKVGPKPVKQLSRTLSKADIKRGMKVRVMRKETLWAYSAGARVVVPGVYTATCVSQLQWERCGAAVTGVWFTDGSLAALDNLEAA